MNADRLAAAKLWLVSEQAADVPYLAQALFALVPVASVEVPTTAVDERWRLYVNPDWLAGAPVPAIGTELAHQVWHLLCEHADRARDLRVDATTAGPWRDAADVTIVHTLGAAGLCHDGRYPHSLRHAAGLELPPHRSAEEYYATLSRLPPAAEAPSAAALAPQEGCGSGSDGIPRRHELPADADVGTVDEESAHQIRHHVAVEYRRHVSTRGLEPGTAGRWASRILEPRIPWEPLLAGAVRRAAGWTNGRVEPTYTRPSRRQSAVPRVLLPGMRRPMPRVTMVVDTSGSVDDQLLGRALGEVDGALRAIGVGNAAVTVLACDAAVQCVGRVRRARDATLAGGGGTDLRVGIAAASGQRPRPDLIVVLTDGYTPWPAAAPAGSAVIAGVLGRDRRHLPPTPAWATRVECLLEG